MSRIFSYPRECQVYLEQKYGLKPYSDRHLKKKIVAGTFPEPFEISPRRKGLTDDQLDNYANEILARAQ